MYHSSYSGIESWHEFSAGAHYDPSNVSFGPVIGLDEHVVSPGAGFGWHAHRGVQIVSVVLEGALRHEDSSGAVRVVRPGSLLVQSAGDGIRHAETNASCAEPLRFLQVTVLGDAPGAVRVAAPPVSLAGVTVSIRCAGVVTGPALVFRGNADVVRVIDGESVDPAGEVVAVEFTGES